MSEQWDDTPELKIGGMAWLNQPPQAKLSDGILELTSGSKTDFWQGTFYGFHRDDGHFLHRKVEGDFSMTARFSGDYRELYDQAGLMVRVDQEHWMKCGIEFTDGLPHFSVVVTKGQSDWSAQTLTSTPNPIDVRVTRLRDCLFIQFATTEGEWQMARLTPLFALTSTLQVGLAFCSPTRAGFVARYTAFNITAPQIADIHD